MLKHYFLIITFLLSLKALSQKEARLPYSNIEYNSMSLRPLNLLQTDFAVRFYINIGSSVDRIITLQVDTFEQSIHNHDSLHTLLLQGKIQTIGKLYYYDGDSSIHYFNEEILEKEQVSILLKKIISMNLWEYQSRTSVMTVLHKPNSLYTIELKSKNEYHIFYFYTLYPTESEENTIYGDLQKSIFKMFPDIEKQIIKN